MSRGRIELRSRLSFLLKMIQKFTEKWSLSFLSIVKALTQKIIYYKTKLSIKKSSASLFVTGRKFVNPSSMASLFNNKCLLIINMLVVQHSIQLVWRRQLDICKSRWKRVCSDWKKHMNGVLSTNVPCIATIWYFLLLIRLLFSICSRSC